MESIERYMLYCMNNVNMGCTAADNLKKKSVCFLCFLSTAFDFNFFVIPHPTRPTVLHKREWAFFTSFLFIFFSFVRNAIQIFQIIKNIISVIINKKYFHSQPRFYVDELVLIDRCVAELTPKTPRSGLSSAVVSTSQASP